MSLLALIGEGIKKFSWRLEGRLSPRWKMVDIDRDRALRPRVAAAVGMPGALRWKEELPGLRFLQLTGAGLDGLVPADLPRGCRVCNVYEHEASIAEYVFTGIFRLENEGWLRDSMAAFRGGRWPHLDRIGEAPRPTVCGKRLGVIGFGHIGRRCAEIARGLNMRVSALRRSKPGSSRAGEVRFVRSVRELARDSDYLLVACPDTPETRGMVDGGVLRLLPPGAKLINISRGAVVEERALYEALSRGRLAGAVLDVWYRYPSSARDRVHGSLLPFHKLRNVLMTPHISAHTEEMVQRRWSLIADNLNRFLRGAPLANVVDTARLGARPLAPRARRGG